MRVSRSEGGMIKCIGGDQRVVRVELFVRRYGLRQSTSSLDISVGVVECAQPQQRDAIAGATESKYTL